MLVRYTSFQAYKLLQEHFPLPSLALLSKHRKGNVDALKVCSYLRESGKIFQDIIVMVDEMYLRKCNRRDGVVVRASASQSVDLGFISLVESYQKTLKNGIHSFPAWRSAHKG